MSHELHHSLLQYNIRDKPAALFVIIDDCQAGVFATCILEVKKAIVDSTCEEWLLLTDDAEVGKCSTYHIDIRQSSTIIETTHMVYGYDT